MHAINYLNNTNLLTILRTIYTYTHTHIYIKMIRMVTRQNKCCYTIFHVSNSIIIFVIKYIQSIYYVTFTRFYNIPLYRAKMFIYVQIKRTRSDITTTRTMAELFVIFGLIFVRTLIDNRLLLWQKKKEKKRERERITAINKSFRFIKTCETNTFNFY